MNAQPVEPGAPSGVSPSPIDTTALLQSLTGEERSTYDLTGDLPESKRPAGVSADSPSAPSGDQSASTDATSDAASEPAPPSDSKPKKNLQTRREQVDREVTELQERIRLKKALREELAQLDRSDAKPAASSPATDPTPAEWERYAKHPDAPREDQFETYADFATARALFVTKAFHAEQQRTARADAESRSRLEGVQRTIADFDQRIADVTAKDPAFLDALDPQLLQISPDFAMPAGTTPGPHNAILGEIIRSPHAPALLRHFSTPEGKQEWAALLKSGSEAAFLKAFGRIEARFESTGSPAASAPAKTVTSAPAPPLTLGHKASSPVDDVTSAIKAGDFSAYESRMNARDVAAR